MFSDIQAGRLPRELAALISPAADAGHREHIQSLQRTARYQVCDLEIQVAPGLYHPHLASSSAFILRTLLREGRALGELLELGCGSGVLSLALLKEGLAESATLLDISAVAVSTAAGNALAAGLADRTHIRESDLFAAVTGERFDSVLFNLPLQHTAQGDARHPALDDLNGDLARRFFDEVDRHLEPCGAIYFSYSNLSDPMLLEAFGRQRKIELVAAEWVAASGIWLLIYRAEAARLSR